VDRAARPRGSIALVVTPKPGGGTRILTRLDAGLAEAYGRAVAAATPSIERALGPGVSAARAHVRPDGALAIDPWRPAHRRYRRAVRRLAARPGALVFVGDVRDCFPSIGPASVERALRSLGADRDVRAGLVGLLRELEDRGIRGLPVGPGPSAVVANAVLAAVDRELAAVAGGPILRWVDDVAVPVRDERVGVSVAHAFERTLASVGLEPAAEKCLVVEAAGLAAGPASASTASGAARGMMRAP
jgi:hypothetical protein